jgi:hypothetical protein
LGIAESTKVESMNKMKEFYKLACEKNPHKLIELMYDGLTIEALEKLGKECVLGKNYRQINAPKVKHR